MYTYCKFFFFHFWKLPYLNNWIYQQIDKPAWLSYELFYIPHSKLQLMNMLVHNVNFKVHTQTHQVH